MKKEWYSAKELVGIAGLPSSPQGINLMARREGWEYRRKRGVQGKALEYHINSLPEDVLNVLSVGESTVDYANKRQDPFLIWIEAYYQLTKVEREKIVKFILREGLAKLIGYIDVGVEDAEKNLESD
ncbi:DNA-binding protein [Photorhabdus namnaonensis]|uniref:Mu DNA-binding domain protein n=1 Tax=Photorhabdus namnaonensis TaxID=1851568 RepID=A0A1B8YBK6_9GAMM|nr:DNA-binding protein [Photorhabdus namnaonensis]OCA52529.1 Mu DNA-binding domain protein [Photorhabdus namnaonensis]